MTTFRFEGCTPSEGLHVYVCNLDPISTDCIEAGGVVAHLRVQPYRTCATGISHTKTTVYNERLHGCIPTSNLIGIGVNGGYNPPLQWFRMVYRMFGLCYATVQPWVFYPFSVTLEAGGLS